MSAGNIDLRGTWTFTTTTAAAVAAADAFQKISL